MKNIHVLSTDKPSILFIDNDDKKLRLCKKPMVSEYALNQNIYITNNEEIKEIDYFINTLNGKVLTNLEVSKSNILKKIILTTDEQLIRYGVQAIDDEFLEWFVKNPNCEEIEVDKIKEYKGNYLDCFHTQGQCDCGLKTCKQILFIYKIIIPKEEPKQFKGRGMLHYSGKIIGGEPKQENTAEYIDRHIVEAMVEVAKQKMYSEEEVEDLIYKVCGTVARLQGITLNGNHIDTAYKQFKKK